MQCRTPRETNPKGHWGPNYFLIKILVFVALHGGPGMSWVPQLGPCTRCCPRIERALPCEVLVVDTEGVDAQVLRSFIQHCRRYRDDGPLRQIRASRITTAALCGRQTSLGPTTISRRGCSLGSAVRAGTFGVFLPHGSGGQLLLRDPRHTRTTREKNKQGFFQKIIWPPMALGIGLLRSSALQIHGHITPVILQCRTPQKTNPKGQ